MNSRDISLCLPASLGAWRGEALEVDRESFAPGAGGIFIRRYVHGGKAVIVFVSYFARQSHGAELIGWDSRITSADPWFWLTLKGETIRADGHDFLAGVTRLHAKERPPRLLWFWYWVDSQYTSNSVLAKALQMRSILPGGERRAAFIAISTVEHGSQQNAAAVLREFLSAVPSLGTVLKGAGADTGPC